MRLIDADLLLKEINGEENQRADKLMSEWYVEMVKRQPIVYDVDKVVELLEELTNTEYEKPENCDENGFGDGEEIYEDGITQGKYEAYKKALEIAKSGGIE